MKVSIITICYNSEETIEDTVRSVLNQTYGNIEYIIVDGLSKDKTLSILDRYKTHFSHFISAKDKGIYDAMNKGVALAQGEVVGILNSDDMYNDKNVIRDVVQTLDQKQCDALYADLVYVNRNNTDKVKRYWRAGKYKKSNFLNGWMPPHPTFFVKKRFYDQLGAYRLELKSSADYELMLRFLFKNDLKAAYLPRIITRMRMGGQSNVSLKNRLFAHKEDYSAWEINDLKPKPLTLALKPLRKIIQLFRRP